MQRSALVAFLLLLVLVGAGAVWLLQGSDPMAVPGAQTGSPEAAAKPVAATPVQADGPRGDLAAAGAGGDAAARERAALPATPSASGERYFVRGRLVDRAGAPRAAVELQLEDWAAADLEFDALPPELPNLRMGNAARVLPSWRTGADGRFEIPLARGRDGALRLADKELVFAGEPPYLRSKKGDQDLGDLRVLRACSLAGVVQDASGAPVADVKVGRSLGTFLFSAEQQVTTDAQGRFRLAGLRPGTWSVRTASSRFLPAMLDVELAEEQTRDDLVLVVKPGQAIAGQVVDERGVGVAGMKVGSQRKEARGAMEIERFSADEATTTDANGYFTLSGLGDDAVTVRAHGPGHTSARATEVAVGTGNLVLRVQRCGAIEGVLRSADGKPIADSIVRVAVPGVDVGFAQEMAEDFDPMGGGDNFRGTRTLADGTFRLENVRPGSITVAANGSGHRRVVQRDVTVAAGETTRGVVLLAERGTVATVTVVDPDGKPVAGAKVEIRKPQARRTLGGNVMAARVAVADVAEGGNVVIDGGEPLGTGTTDDKGITTIAGLPATAVEVVAEHANFAASLPASLSLPATGGVEVGVALRKAAFAEIAVVDTAGSPLAGTQVELRSADEARDGVLKTEPTDGEGRVRFGPLPAGAYVAKLLRKPAAQRFGDSMMTFGGNGGEIPGSAQALQLVGGETTKLVLQRPVATTLRGVVLGADGPVAACEIELQSREMGGLGIPGGAAGSATTAADGTFAIDDVLAGDYTLRFGKATQRVKCTQDVSVPPNVAEFRQDLALHTGKLRAQVVLAGSGEPIGGAEVEVVAAKKEGGEAPREQRVMMISMVAGESGGGDMTTMSLGGTQVRSGSDGMVEIEDVPVGEWSLQVTHKKFAPVTSKPLTVVERQTTDAGRIELAAAGSVRGTVVGSDGKKLGLALVMHRAIGTENWSAPQPAMGGNFRLDSLPTGRHELRAQELTQDGAERFSPVVEVQVVAGETATAELRMPAR